MENDPDSEIIDIYGFRRSLDFVIREKDHRNHSLEIDNQKNLDWCKLIKISQQNPALTGLASFSVIPSDLFHSMVQRGIPVALRPQVWPLISNSCVHQSQKPIDYFSNLVHDICIDESIVGVNGEDIKKDLHRTFPDHARLGSLNGQAALWHVLAAFSLHRPEIGYCQSLNFLAGTMLLFLSEESAFWLLDTITSDSKYFPVDYFTSSMLAAHVDQHIFAYLIQERLPEVLRCLLPYRIDLPLVCMPWFLCLFINVLPTETALRTWDMFLLYGTSALFRISLSLFQFHVDALVESKDDVGLLFNELKNIGHLMFDADLLLNVSYGPLACSVDDCTLQLLLIETQLIKETTLTVKDDARNRFSIDSFIKRRTSSVTSTEEANHVSMPLFRLSSTSLTARFRSRSMSGSVTKRPSFWTRRSRGSIADDDDMKGSNNSNWRYLLNIHDSDKLANEGSRVKSTEMIEPMEEMGQTSNSFDLDDVDEEEEDGFMWMSNGMSKLSTWFGRSNDADNPPSVIEEEEHVKLSLAAISTSIASSISSFLRKSATQPDFKLSCITSSEIDALREDFGSAVRSQMESIEELRRQNKAKAEIDDIKEEPAAVVGDVEQVEQQTEQKLDEKITE